MASTYENNLRLKRLLLATIPGVSFTSYGAGNWASSIKMLMGRKYSDAEIIAIMLSQWTRFAADGRSGRGLATAKDLTRLLDKQTDHNDVTVLVGGYPKDILKVDTHVW